MIEQTNLLLLIALLTLNYGFSQDLPTDSLYSYEFADTPPTPIGGMEAVYNLLAEQKSDTIFNRTDTLDCSTFRGGKVLLSFTVMKDAKLSNIQIAYGLGEPYDSYCIELVEQLPVVWQPGTKDGLPVNVKSALPISFCQNDLTESEKKKKHKKNYRAVTGEH